MILNNRLPNPLSVYNDYWANQLIRVIEGNFRNIQNEFDTVFTYTPTGYFGSFYDTTTQTISSANTAYPITIDTTVLAKGLDIVDGSKITFSNAGVYNIQFSAQITKTTAPRAYVWIWLRKNGIDIDWSATKVHVEGSTPFLVPAWNFVENFNRADYAQLMWASDSTDVQLLTEAASSPVPAIPSVILTVVQEARL
jgi:hypothetical protein